MSNQVKAKPRKKPCPADCDKNGMQKRFLVDINKDSQSLASRAYYERCPYKCKKGKNS